MSIMKRYVVYLTVAVMGVAVMACRARRGDATVMPQERPESMVVGHSSMIPKAVVYRTNGPFADNVPVTMNRDRSRIVSFPDPSDVRGASAPVLLADGYLLDRRGVGINTAFTRYTYSEYAAMESAPSVERLREMVIPGSIVTDLVKLPFPLSTALSDTARVNRIIRQGFPDCEVVVERKAVAPFL